MNINELRKILIEKYDYPLSTVDDVAGQIMSFSPVWAEAFIAYLQNGSLSDLVCEEYSLHKLVAEMGYTPIGAFLTMDSLMKSPDVVLKMLKQGIR